MQVYTDVYVCVQTPVKKFRASFIWWVSMPYPPSPSPNFIPTCIRVLFLSLWPAHPLPILNTIFLNSLLNFSPKHRPNNNSNKRKKKEEEEKAEGSRRRVFS